MLAGLGALKRQEERGPQRPCETRAALTRQNIIYFTINTPDIQGEPKLEIKPTEISFSATSGE